MLRKQMLASAFALGMFVTLSGPAFADCNTKITLTSTGVQSDASGTAELRAVDTKQRIKVSIDSPVPDGTVYAVVTKTARGAKVLGSLTISLGSGELELENNKGKGDPNATDPFCTVANVAVVDGNLQAILFGVF